MKPTVYIETSIVSYLTAWRSPQLVMAANQEVTRTWRDDYRQDYELRVSQFVVNEASRGDVEAAKRRLEVIDPLPLLDVTPEVIDLAKQLFTTLRLPQKAELDALHIAVASVHNVDFLLTWNCRHIANATLRHLIETTCSVAGFSSPTICTPLELIEDDDNVS